MALTNNKLGNAIEIKPNSGDSHQTSPAWMLTVLSFQNPATNEPLAREVETAPVGIKNEKPSWPSQSLTNATETKDPLIITSDCISLSVEGDKGNPLGSFSATLVGGRYNYMARINNGDYVIVNIKDYEDGIFNQTDNDSLYNRASNGQAINRAGDGFKGVYKITSVREQVSSLPNGGQRVIYQVRGQSFTEFNNVIYFNPYIANSLKVASTLFYMFNISETWQNKVGIALDLQSIVSQLLEVILGKGPRLKNALEELKKANKGVAKEAIPSLAASPNGQFKIPKGLGALLNFPSVTNFNELYRMMLGIQTYRTRNLKADGKIDQGSYQPENLQPSENNYYQTDNPITGRTTIRPEYWNQSTGWSILTSYANPPVNEMFTTFRLSPEGHVMPFFVFRQIPFSSNGFVKRNGRGTRFLSLPRWKVDPSMVYDASFGREDNARFNFVQVFGLPFGWVPKSQQLNVAYQTANNSNLASDPADIARSGLRPYVLHNSLDFPNENAQGGSIFKTPYWAKLLGDALIGGHMKLNGMIACAGLEEDIAVGDNLEYNGIVFHIEGIRHECKVEANGGKSFTTVLKLTHGVDATENNNFTVYGQTINNLYSEESNVDPSLPKITSEGDVSELQRSLDSKSVEAFNISRGSA